MTRKKKHPVLQMMMLLQVMVMKDPATRRSRGFGFITFTQAGSVSKVIITPISSTTVNASITFIASIT